MKEWVHRMFAQYMPVRETLNNEGTLMWTHTLGGLLITITFIVLGLLFFLVAKKTTERNSAFGKRMVMSKLFGTFLIFCGVSRGFDVLCIWYNYAYIAAYFKLLTGITSVAALLYIPVVVKAIKETHTINQISTSLDETNRKIDKLTEITKETK